LSVEGSVGPVVIVIVLPLLKLVVKQVDVVRDAVLVEQLVKLLFVDTM
jgi:hypothetical protein